MKNPIHMLSLLAVLWTPIMVSAQQSVDVEALLKRMSLQEKVGQMAQVTIDVFVDQKTYQPVDSMIRKGIVDYRIGSVLNTWDNVAHSPEEWNRMVKLLQQQTRKTPLTIPLIYGVDAIHGATYTKGATMFPQQIAQAATFNRQLVRACAEMSAYETRACSLPWNFSPVLDLGVDPRWPRLWETFGEDPYLVSALGTEMVHGYQGSKGPDIDGLHLAACAKHYLGYSVPVSGKDRTPANIPDPVLREYHLPPFQAAVDAGLSSIMVNSGLINGEPVHASKRIITDLLKNELKFEGVVVTDWNDIENLYRRDRVASSRKDAVRLAVNAGIDMSMIPYDFRFCDDLIELVNEGSVSMTRIDDAVRRILKLKQRLGLFDKAWDDRKDYPEFASAAHQAKARETAAEAITLLKNEDGVLPFKKGIRLLVTGPNAHSMRALNGGWSYSWQGEKAPRFTEPYHTILEALQQTFGSDRVTYVPGVRYVEGGKYWEETVDNMDEAVKAAASVDAVVLCLGENSYAEKPGDLQDLYLSDLQTQLAQRLVATGKPIVLVLNEGRPRIISRFEKDMKAVLMTYLPGNYGADALADLLCGAVNPSGKLPFNYPRYPQSLIPDWHKYAEEQLKAEGMYNYESDYSPQWEFGTGLSYTSFRYDRLRLSSTTVRAGDNLEVSVDVTNTGKLQGKEAVLLYLSDLVASLAPDKRRLKGFDKISLNSGETKTVTFTLTPKEMSFIDSENRQTLEPGDFEVRTGSLIARFTVIASENDAKKPQGIVQKQGCHFVINGRPYRFIGANFWYGAILGSPGRGGDRVRLLRELDLMKANGITNLRVLIGADGPNGVPTKVEPTLQLKPGVYNDSIFDGLDFLLSELGKRDMKAVLFFTNAWEWSGGYGQYLEWAGKGKAPIPNIDGWPAYLNFVKQYAFCDSCTELLKHHIRHVLERQNCYNGRKYTEDPAIFAWEIGNEPRAFSEEGKPAFSRWLRDISAYIKSLDCHHLVTIGTEGKHGCEEDLKLFEETHADPNIDYLVMHIWPKNWSWLDVKDIPGSLGKSVDSTVAYMEEHEAVARKLQKPIVLEEFGFPRDHHRYEPTDGTVCRDAYYQSAFERILRSSATDGVLAGCNIWAWGGFGRPRHLYWQPGDDYLGDPAQEEQGLNSVFNVDQTVPLIKKYASLLSKEPVIADSLATDRTKALFANLRKSLGKGILFGHQDDPAYGHNWFNESGRSDVKETAGDYPAVVGWELGGLDVGAGRNLDSVAFTDMRRLMREVYDRGSVNTVSFHAFNIATGKDAWDCAQDTVVRSILPGGVHHEAYLKRLDRLADFFFSLKAADGKPIPVIFRMYHEMSGTWFWWGSRQCTPEEYKALYRMTEAYLRDVRQVHQLLYAFSPNDVKEEADFLTYYPGDKWVDVVGFDFYLHWDKTDRSVADYRQRMSEGLRTVTDYARKTGKIPVLAETGLEGILIPDFYTNVLAPLIEPFDISYILLWRNAYAASLKHHFYVPYAGHPAANDFKRFTQSRKIWLSEDLPDLYSTADIQY